ncbi:MAG: 3-oxoacyl-[acyl-carrier protein] reductase [Saprospiraceae bacterium]|jgi:3-oxoacyl-[acyl-carrier protein] reductase
MSDLFLQNQLCLVTGASRGIGAAIAQKLSGLGATVVGTATSQKGADAISIALGDNGTGMVLNVTDAESISDLLAAINEKYGAISILVNNAGITRDNLLMRMKEEEWDDIMDTNLKSVYRMSKACLRGMTKARFGRIINISSVVGATGNAGQANYAAAKAGLIGFSRSLAQEIATRNITVNVVAPGFIQTDMTDDLPEAQKEALLTKIPMARLGSPDDVAGAVAYLASPWAEYVTGSVIHVNGGMYMG